MDNRRLIAIYKEKLEKLKEESARLQGRIDVCVKELIKLCPEAYERGMEDAKRRYPPREGSDVYLSGYLKKMNQMTRDGLSIAKP